MDRKLHKHEHDHEHEYQHQQKIYRLFLAVNIKQIINQSGLGKHITSYFLHLRGLDHLSPSEVKCGGKVTDESSS